MHLINMNAYLSEYIYVSLNLRKRVRQTPHVYIGH